MRVGQFAAVVGTTALGIGWAMAGVARAEVNLITAANGVTEIAQMVMRWLPLGIWLGALAVGLLVMLALRLYEQQKRWRRIELARREVKAFRERDAVRRVLDILDYEEYRTFYITHPRDGRRIGFEAHDGRLRRALRSHDQMVKTRRGLDEITRLTTTDSSLSPETLAVVKRYEDEEFLIEVILRDWFDSFLGGMEYFEIMISSGLINADEIKPFIIYWIRLIGDRTYRRKGGSGFYDQLFHYIYWAGYGGVQRLFERYGYKILPPPYSTHDFVQMDINTEHDSYRALYLAKAAYLVYEDRDYVSDIVRYWLSEDIDNVWQKMSDRAYVIDVMKSWLREGKTDYSQVFSQNFKYLDVRLTDTQAFLFRKGKNVVLVFRGSQQLADWKTNFKMRLTQFTTVASSGVDVPRGRVHRGFLEAWQSVEKQVVYYLKQWWTDDTQLWVTGHSLGGALAAMASVSLEAQGYAVSGLYTFGQPRIAGWGMVNAVNSRMGDRIMRYANNNDVVPLIPPQITPWMPSRVYGHLGRFRYFTHRGRLMRHSFLGRRWLDRLAGFLKALATSGPDAIDDHKMEFYMDNLQRALEREREALKVAAEKAILEGDYTEDPS